MKVPFAAPATFSFCTLLSGCVEQAPDTAVTRERPPGPATIVNEVLHRRPSASDCFRDRIAEYRKTHGTTAPIRESHVADWQEYCQGT